MSDAFEIEQNSVPSPIHGVTQFVRQIEGAAAFLTAAHADDGVPLPTPKVPNHRQAHSRHGGWYSFVVNASATRLRHVLMIFSKHPAQGRGTVAELAAFKMLSELTPAGPQLMALAKRDRSLAYKELARHMDLVRQQFEATAALVDNLPDGADGNAASGSGNVHFAAVRDALLARAGGALSLTDAAKRLGVSRQALHKRITSGSVLGMMQDREIVIPTLQFVEDAGKVSILPGIDQITKLFKSAEAGAWSALQFLVEQDPNLGRPPIQAITGGKVIEAVQTARAFLNLDEE